MIFYPKKNTLKALFLRNNEGAAKAQLELSHQLNKDMLNDRMWAVYLQSIIIFWADSRFVLWFFHFVQFLFSMALLIFGSPLFLIIAGNTIPIPQTLRRTILTQ